MDEGFQRHSSQPRKLPPNLWRGRTVLCETIQSLIDGRIRRRTRGHQDDPLEQLRSLYLRFVEDFASDKAGGAAYRDDNNGPKPSSPPTAISYTAARTVVSLSDNARDRVRATIYRPKSNDGRLLKPTTRCGGKGDIRQELDLQSVVGVFYQELLEDTHKQYEYFENTKRRSPPGFDKYDESFGTILAVPIRCGRTSLGLLFVDSPQAGDLELAWDRLPKLYDIAMILACTYRLAGCLPNATANDV